MNAQLGATALWYAFLMALGSAALAGWSGRTARPNVRPASELTFGLSALATLLACATLAQRLMARDLTLVYVANTSSLMLTSRAALTALWAAGAGQAVTVAALLAMVLLMQVVYWRRQLSPWLLLVFALLLAMAIAMAIAAAPFTLMRGVPADGRGLHPQLRHPAMFVQPPLLMLALLLPLVPGATVLARWLGSGSDAWRQTTNQCFSLSWALLTTALGLGLWWAQSQLGWFGYYFTWEPFASAPLLPWLALSAVLLIVRTGADRTTNPLWTSAFIVFTSFLCAASLYRMRGGIGASVRAVSATPPWAVMVLGAATLLITTFMALLLWRSAGASPRTRIGAALLTLGTLNLAVGLTASNWRREITTSIDTGQVITNIDPFGTVWRFTSQGLSSYQETDHTVLAVAVTAAAQITGNRGARDKPAFLNSPQRQYVDAVGNAAFDPATTVGSLTLWRETVALGFLGPIDRTNAAIRLSFIPLVSCLWIGAFCALVGMPLTMRSRASGEAPERFPSRLPADSSRTPD